MVNPSSGVCHKKHWHMLQYRWIWNNMAKWKKPVTKGYTLHCSIYMNRQIYQCIEKRQISGWLWTGRRGEGNGHRISSRGWWKYSKINCGCGCTILSIYKNLKLYITNWWLAWYVNCYLNKAIVLKNIYTQSITSSPLNNISHIIPYHLAILCNRKSIRFKIKPDSHQS